MAIQAQQYTFHCRFKTDAILPGYLGSTLRGALGWGLKKISCALKREQCEMCMLRQQCAYAWIFETERYQTGDGRIVNARPHPFVLQPEMNRYGHQKEGSDLVFSLLLFGRANEFPATACLCRPVNGRSRDWFRQATWCWEISAQASNNCRYRDIQCLKTRFCRGL